MFLSTATHKGIRAFNQCLTFKLSTPNTQKRSLPAEGLEPTRSCDHWILSPARLPIPPRRHFTLKRCFTYGKRPILFIFIVTLI
jgi:hypothetical protein